MNREEAIMISDWIDHASNNILIEVGNAYAKTTAGMADTDRNIVIHALLMESIFYKFYISLMECVADEGKEEQLEDLITNMRKFRLKVRDEETMIALKNQKAE